MREIFNYDSKIMQTLMKLADMLILNVLYLICCLPIVTIGAAQAGMFSAMRQLTNKEDDNSPIKAFFKGFFNGFWKVTAVHTVFLVVLAIVVWILSATLVIAAAGGSRIPVWMCLAVLAVIAIFHSMLGPFHASFDCTTLQLAKNTYFVTMAYPLCAIAVGALVWLPAVVMVLDVYIFMRVFPVWSALYYSVAYLFSYSILKLAIAQLKDDFQKSQNPAEEQVG